jgi:nicotinate-nucleotide adenylyltransferase
VLDTPPIGISSTLVRERAAAGRTVRYLVPGAVAGFIDEHRMYRRP